MSAVLKTKTGLTGLKVAKNAKNTLLVLYDKILKELSKMPQSSMYRMTTEELVNHRASIVKSATTEADIEIKLASGQIEEVINQAKNELTLARQLLDFKPWDSLVEKEPKNQWKWPPV